MNVSTTKSDLPRFVLDLLRAVPHRGEGLNLWLYKVARVMHPWRQPGEIVHTLSAITAGEPVKPGEIERAVERSAQTAWKPGQEQVSVTPVPAWPTLNREQLAVVLADGFGLVDLWEASPIRLESSQPRTEEIIDALFPSNPLLCVGQDKAHFATRTREQLRGRLTKLALMVPSPMSAPTGVTREGKVSEHSLASTGPRRFLVIEFDQGTTDEHAAIFLHLAAFAPLALAVHSGSKSLHGWFYCAGEPEAGLRWFMNYAVSLGADRATWSLSQFVRLLDGLRDNAKRQTGYLFNPVVVS